MNDIKALATKIALQGIERPHIRELETALANVDQALLIFTNHLTRERVRAEIAETALHELQTKLHMTRAGLQLITGELNAGEWRTIKAVFTWLLKEPEHE